VNTRNLQIDPTAVGFARDWGYAPGRRWSRHNPALSCRRMRNVVDPQSGCLPPILRWQRCVAATRPIPVNSRFGKNTSRLSRKNSRFCGYVDK
jgi:hypothetical protein